MKTFILSLAFIGVFRVIEIKAQTYNDYSALGQSYNLNLTKDQVIRIKEMNKAYGRQFETIGRDRSLTGQEKGQKKRELSLKRKQEVLNILTPEQREMWQNNYDRKDKGIKDSLTDTLDDRLNDLEDWYNREKNVIENDLSLSKAQKEEMEDLLKERYKMEKEYLKTQKKHVKDVW